MNQKERRIYLIRHLLNEQPEYQDMAIPNETSEQKKLLRALFNIRTPKDISPEFLSVQDEYLENCREEKGVVSLADFHPVQKELYIWQGDITRLAVDAIVNAANSGMTGCYQPNHTCIDNCIHTFAGVQLRLACARQMQRQGHEEPTGQAKITPGFNLPCKYVLHTVGPIVNRTLSGAAELTEKHCELLASCYRSCLTLAEEHHCKSIAFCCISTGVFCFPNERAAEIAIQTVKEYKTKTGSDMQVVFNVWKDEDDAIYKKLLRAD